MGGGWRPGRENGAAGGSSGTDGVGGDREAERREGDADEREPGGDNWGRKHTNTKKLMAYNRVNILRHYKAMLEETDKHYDPDVTTYKGVWRKYIYPVYHISYSQYMKIVSTPNLEKMLEEEEKRHGKWEDPAQGRLF